MKPLSKREREIYDMLCRGMSSIQISETLYISKHTVDTHRRRIIKKLNILSTTSLIVNRF
ncbi:MAG: helix-turn-helix transcriptional regulator [Bacteroidales bacterium]|nr:helix-turn-helix transcriptional regulator [Bacteroidales bacterium]